MVVASTLPELSEWTLKEFIYSFLKGVLEF